MKRKAVYLEGNRNLAIYVDKKNIDAIVNYIQQDQRHQKKWNYIKTIILENLRVPDVFDKEDINDDCKDVYAMKFFKGQENDRIYCKKVKHATKNYVVIVASELHLKKKTQKNSSKELTLIKNIANYDYDFEE